MQIVYWKIKQIKPYKQNPRINSASIDAVAESIAEFGFKQPLVCKADGELICGHTRLQAAIKLNIDEVPVLVADDLTNEQVRQFRIIDNSTHDLATWDLEKLVAELDDMPDVDFKMFGLDLEAEIAKAQGLMLDNDGEESPEDGRKQNNKITIIVDDVSLKAEIKEVLESALSDYGNRVKIK